MSYENIIVEKLDGKIALIRLNRPKCLNALNTLLLNEVAEVLQGFEYDNDVMAVVLTGSERAFAAGADIVEMQDKNVPTVMELFQRAGWDAVGQFKKPIIGAVNGLALGGGFELALQCDILIAADNARFGLPEVNLGVIPGAGGTQRTTRVIGKSLAMEMMLNARQLTAPEAFDRGLISRILPADEVVDNALQMAREIAGRAPLAVKMAKESVNVAFETSLDQGLKTERRNIALLFGTEDKMEGMKAFVEKRPADWQGK